MQRVVVDYVDELQRLAGWMIAGGCPTTSARRLATFVFQSPKPQSGKGVQSLRLMRSAQICSITV